MKQKNIHTLLTHTDNADKHTAYHLLQLWCCCSAVTLAGVISATTLHGQIWLHLFSQEGVISKQQCMALNIRLDSVTKMFPLDVFLLITKTKYSSSS